MRCTSAWHACLGQAQRTQRPASVHTLQLAFASQVWQTAHVYLLPRSSSGLARGARLRQLRLQLRTLPGCCGRLGLQALLRAAARLHLRISIFWF